MQLPNQPRDLPILPDIEAEHIFERISRLITLSAFGLCILVYVAAPLLALAWRQQPFPGFLVEHTLVVNDRIGQGWTGRMAGLQSPYAVTRIATVPVVRAEEFDASLSGLEIGESIQVFSILPDGTVRLFPSVELIAFPPRDFTTLFWLPFVIGLVYLTIGVWVYRTSGSTRPGRALAFFCVCIALVVGLLFDVLTTHRATGLWILAVAFLGGALISLALRFPLEWKLVSHRPWILALPYLASLGLAGWATYLLYDMENPWAFLSARSAIYRYTAVACLFFLAVMLYRARSSSASIVRRQARMVVLGSAVAFLPIVVWFLAPVVGVAIPFNSVAFLPGLVLFPIIVGMAILRYRLLEVDSLVNRAVVYGVLTTFLAGVFAASIGLSQRLFVAITGERSDAAVVLTTLIVVSAATPVKDRVQTWVDRQFRELPASAIRSFGEQVRSFVQMNDADLLAKRFLDETARALGAESGALIRYRDGQPKVCHTYGSWRGHALVSVPLQFGGESFGSILLGPRLRGKAYQQYEVESLSEVSAQVARALHIASVSEVAAPVRTQAYQSH